MKNQIILRLPFLFFVLLGLYSSQLNAQIAQKTIYIETGTYAELDYYRSYMSVLNPGLVFFHKKRLSLAAEANIFKFWNPDYSSIGLGLRPAVKYYPVQRPKYSLFAEIKGGPIYMFPEFEKEAINFTFLASLGGEVPISPHNTIYAGAGYTHYSNGKRSADLKNPTWDGFGAHVGIAHVLH